jgi:hypothetical protein
MIIYIKLMYFKDGCRLCRRLQGGPTNFSMSQQLAAERGKPIVLIKIGRSELGAVLPNTG